MRKSLLIALIALVCPVLAMAQNTNKEFSKTARAQRSQLTEERLYVTPAVVAPVVAGDAPSYTMAAVVKIDAVPNATDCSNNAVIMGYGGRDNINDNGCWNLCLRNDGLLGFTGWGGLNGAVSDTPLPLNEYVHLYVAYDSTSNTTYTYVNGELMSTMVWTKVQEWFTNEYPALYFASWQFGGLMDDIQIYNKCLSAEDVQLAMSAPKAVDGLVALYTMDEVAEGTTGQFADQSGANAPNLNCETITAKSENRIWSNGIAYLFSNAPSWANYSGSPYAESVVETAPTLVESDRVVAPVDVTVSVAEVENGTLVLKNGEEVVESGATVASGTELTIEATPAEGYKLVSVTANGEVVEGNTYTVLSDVTFGATFSNESYALTVVNDANLEYSLTLNGEAVTDLTALVGGAEYKLAVTVPNEYTLNSVTLNDEELTATDGVYTFSMTQASTLVIAATEKAKYTVTVTPSSLGTIAVTADGAAVASGATVIDGTVITITATAEQGYRVATIKANDTTVTNGGTFTVTSDVTISATFEEQTIEYCAPTPAASRTAGTVTRHSERYLSKATISDGTNSFEISYSGDYTSSVFTSAPVTTGRPCFDPAAIIPQLETEAGKTISIVTVGAGTWMNHYIYFDANSDGLDKGDKVYGDFTGGSNPFAGSYTFTVPATLKPGTYRVRFMVNWHDNQGPCEYGEGSDNGDLIFDFDIVIPSQELDNERTVTVATENAEFGTVAIVDPATEEASVTTKQVDVKVKATPAEGFAFLNWTNAEGEIVSTSATFDYEGEADVELTAHFGHSVSYTVTGNGSFAANTAEGTSISTGMVLAHGTKVTFTLTPAAGKCVALFTVNGQSHASDLVDNQYTVTLNENTNVVVDFADFTAHVSWTVRGNGEVAAGYEADEDFTAPVDNFASGDMISANQFSDFGGLSIFVYPGEVEGNAGEYEEIESVTLQEGDADPMDITDEVEQGCDGGIEGDGTLENGAPFRYYTISQLPSADLMIVFMFTEGGESSAIENIFGDDDTDAPTLFYNLDGVRVNGNALTPGIYIAKKGKKVAKVYVM